MGFSILKEFPTRFLSGDEIVGKAVEVTIREVRKEKVYSPKNNKKDEVLVIYFEGKERGVCIKKQRAKELMLITGSDDTDKWKGKKACMFTEPKEAFGKTQNVIHFRIAATSKEDLSRELDTISLSESAA